MFRIGWVGWVGSPCGAALVPHHRPHGPAETGQAEPGGHDSDSENNEDSQGVSREERAPESESFDDSNNEEPNLEETHNEEPNLGNFTYGISRLELSKIIEDNVKSAFASKEETKETSLIKLVSNQLQI